MCGIAGYLGPESLDQATLELCLDRMAHRGPDFREHVRFQLATGRNLDMLFARLSIIDLDPRAHQPFRLGNLTLVYNGELYNYRELRDELESAGATFRTESDTEVLLAAIDRWGFTALDRFEGMWAFALHDGTTGRLSLCRDRFGEKPLYLYEDKTGLYFGSEVKLIRTLVGGDLPVNRDHVKRFLTNGYKALYKTDETFFEGVRQLAPSTVLHCGPDGDRCEETYWRPHHDPDESMTYNDAVQGVRERLLRAVGLRLRSDVPLAFCMSGGVDSNTLIAVAKCVHGFDVHGFTVTNDDLRYDERNLVRTSVEQLGIEHTEIPVQTDRFLEQLRALVRQHDAPAFTITYYMHWLLMRRIAAEGYRIALSGTGADELFTGYWSHQNAYLADLKDDPNLHEKALSAWKKNALPMVRNPLLQDPNLYLRDGGAADYTYIDADRNATYLKDPWNEPFQEEEFTDSILRNRMLNELFHEIVPVLLHEEDHNAMACSVENRAPFLDRELFEFCYRIPTRHLIRDGVAKVILRDAVEGIVPEEVRLNPEKIGFNASVLSFLDLDDPKVREEILADSPIFEIVRREQVQELLAKEELNNSESKFLFAFLSCKMFLEEFS